MSDKLRDSIEHLRVLAPKLNETTDEAARAIQRVERFLNEEQRVGVPAYVSLRSAEDDAPTLQLGYDRYGDKFRIVVRETAYEMDDTDVIRHHEYDFPLVKSSTATAWAECQRALKLETFAKLPDLVAAVEDRVRREIQAASDTASTVENIMDVLENRPPKKRRSGRHDDDSGAPTADDSPGPDGGGSPPPGNNGHPRSPHRPRF